MGAGAEEGGQRRAEGVGGVVGGVARWRRRVVARGRGVRRRGRREVLALRTMGEVKYIFRANEKYSLLTWVGAGECGGAGVGMAASCAVFTVVRGDHLPRSSFRRPKPGGGYY